MNIQPKIEPGSSSPTNPSNKLEDNPIHDLVKILCVLESRDLRLREEFHLERLSRLHAEFESKKREKMYEKGNGKTIEELQKKNNELEVEVMNLKEKLVDGSNEVDVLRTKIVELESEILELRKLNEKMAEDNNELVVLRGMIGKLEHEILELRKLKKKWFDDSNARDEVQSKVRVMEGDKNDLAELKINTGELKETMKKNLETISELRKENDKRTVEILLGSFYKKFRGMTGRVSRLDDDTNFQENQEEDVSDDEFRNVDAHRTLGVSSSTQLQSKDAQGASSGKGIVNMKKDIEIMHLDNDNNDDEWCMSQGVHEMNAIYGIAVKNEDPTPSSSLAVQLGTKFANAVNTVKRKFSFSDSETSTSSSSDDSLFLDNLTRRSAVSLAKKKKL